MRRRGYYGPSVGQGAAEPKVRFARELRAAPTPAEAIVWGLVRRRGLDGWRFHRQHVIAGFIVDFYCAALRLVIEVDGGIHDAQREADARRDAALSSLGCFVLRLCNDDVLNDPGGTARRVSEVCSRLAASR